MAQLLIKKEGAIGRIVISNPKKLNAMTLAMWQEIPKVLKQLDEDSAVRVIVIMGDGDKSFISGADISQFDGLRDAEEAQLAFNRAVKEAYEAPILCSKPVIACIQGLCYGGGLGFAAACDIRICSDDSTFRMPAARLGLAYPLDGVKRFMDIIGAANTADIFLSARPFNAVQALQMGFVSQVHPFEQFESLTSTYIQMVSENAPLTMTAAKSAINHFLKGPSEGDVSQINVLIESCYSSEDYSEGRKAFAEKRTPQFKGR